MDAQDLALRQTALGIACEAGAENVIDLLLQHGANPNQFVLP